MHRRLLLTAPLLLLGATRPARAGGRVTVLTGLQATFSIASALARGTQIEVIAAFPPDTGMADAAGWLAKRARPDFVAAARLADAAIGIRAVWPADPLYPEVRRQNIRAIEIDASASFQPELAGVAALSAATAAGATQYIWLSLANCVRMTDIVAADLKRLSEADAGQIERNQAAFRSTLLKLRATAEARLAALDDPAAILLTPALAYLLSDMAVRTAAIVAAPDSDWTEAGRTAFAATFARAGTRAVVAAQPPAPETAALLAKLGAKLAVLDTLDPPHSTPDGLCDPDGLLRGLDANLTALLGVLET